MVKEKQKKPTVKKKTTLKRKAPYLKNKDLLAEVISCREEMKMSDKLAKMLTMLTARYGKSPQFGGYSFNEDMQAYALMMLCKTWVGFNPERGSNAFAYYTQSIKNSFKQYLNREKVQRVVRDELLVNNGLNPSFTYTNEATTNDQHYVHDEEDHGQTIQDLQTVNEDIDTGTKSLLTYTK